MLGGVVGRGVVGGGVVHGVVGNSVVGNSVVGNVVGRGVVDSMVHRGVDGMVDGSVHCVVSHSVVGHGSSVSNGVVAEGCEGDGGLTSHEGDKSNQSKDLHNSQVLRKSVMRCCVTFMML